MRPRLFIIPLVCWFVVVGIPLRAQQPSLAPAYIYAVMSQLAYEPRNPERLALLPEGWELLLPSSANGQNDSFGYFGIAFVNHASRQVIIAHRGTDQVTISRLFSKTIDVDDDLRLLQGKVPGQFEHSTQPFISQVYARMFTDGIADYAVSHTGHSLGAALAEMSAATEPFTAAVTFDSPGAPLGDSARGAVIVSYLAAPNFINTVNRHVGRVILVDGDWLNLRTRFLPRGFAGLTTPHLYLTSYVRYSLEAHSMQRIFETFDRETGEPRHAVDNSRWWPLGVLSSFRNYLFPNRSLIVIRSAGLDPLEFYLKSLNNLETNDAFQDAVDEYVIRTKRFADNLSDVYAMTILTVCGGDAVCIVQATDQCFFGIDSLSFECVKEIAG